MNKTAILLWVFLAAAVTRAYATPPANDGASADARTARGAAIWRQLAQSHWVAEGASHPETVVYSFTDANCPYCHAFWLAAKYYAKAGLQVRHLMVAVVAPSSTGKAAAILQAADPAAALERHERRFASGGLEPVKPDANTLSVLRENRELMRKLGLRGTPGLVFRAADGSLRGKSGMPSLESLPVIFGLPRQEIDDPALQRFR
ncbi:MAG: thiol:disulfide interchange protein DsbG [Gammaproteobacteria bacterium]|jgi:thiol:disulfide interchange protein DsbG